MEHKHVSTLKIKKRGVVCSEVARAPDMAFFSDGGITFYRKGAQI